jgi:hypothetical protein
MAEKKPKAKKPKGYKNLSQKDKFIAAAKAGEADETGDTFAKAMSKLVPKRR